MPVTVRPAIPADAAAVALIYNQSVLSSTATFDVEPKTAEDRRAWLAEHGETHPVLVAEEEGVVVGWGSLSRWSDRCAYDTTVEISVYVDEAHLGRGVGSLLGREILERGRAVGMHAVLSRVCAENETSIRMAERLGFARVGVLHDVGRKFGRWLDVVILEKLL